MCFGIHMHIIYAHTHKIHTPTEHAINNSLELVAIGGYKYLVPRLSRTCTHKYTHTICIYSSA